MLSLHAMQARQSEQAQESMLHWPAISTTMAPELYSLYANAMSSTEEHAAAQQAQAPAERQATQAGRTTAAAESRDAMEEATAAGARADEMAAAEAAEPETALEMMPATEIAEPPAGPMDIDMAGPDASFQQEDFAVGVGSVQMSKSLCALYKSVKAGLL